MFIFSSSLATADHRPIRIHVIERVWLIEEDYFIDVENETEKTDFFWVNLVFCLVYFAFYIPCMNFSCVVKCFIPSSCTTHLSVLSSSSCVQLNQFNLQIYFIITLFSFFIWILLDFFQRGTNQAVFICIHLFILIQVIVWRRSPDLRPPCVLAACDGVGSSILSWRPSGKSGAERVTLIVVVLVISFLSFYLLPASKNVSNIKPLTHEAASPAVITPDWLSPTTVSLLFKHTSYGGKRSPRNVVHEWLSLVHNNGGGEWVWEYLLAKRWCIPLGVGLIRGLTSALATLRTQYVLQLAPQKVFFPATGASRQLLSPSRWQNQTPNCRLIACYKIIYLNVFI